MGVTGSEMMPGGEVVSPLQSEEEQQRNHPFSSLGRQSSIYSLTLDEFQHALCESGKNFWSMNMDEFLNSIWTAEENQAAANPNDNNNNNNNQMNNNSNSRNVSLNQLRGLNDGGRGIAKQPSLPRQGSITLPPPLCRKTVDEVWSEIHKGKQSGRAQRKASDVGDSAQNPEAAHRQPTFGEMTLEDFLIKAGVVREQCTPPPPPPPLQPQQQQYGLYQNATSTPAKGTGFVPRPIMGMAPAGGNGYQATPPQSGNSGAIGESSGRNGGYPPPQSVAVPPPAAVYRGRVGSGGGGGGGGGYGAAGSRAMGVVGPISPASSDGMAVAAGADDAATLYGMDMGGGSRATRKRIFDGPVEKVVERRQRRMIKNRESAARSRARKQAYTVELEAELNQLKEENRQLKHAVAELERNRKQQNFEETRTKAQTKAQKAKEKLRMRRRSSSCPV